MYEWLVELDLETALQQFQDVLVAALELAFLRVLLAPEGVAPKAVGRKRPQLNYSPLSKEARSKKERKKERTNDKIK